MTLDAFLRAGPPRPLPAVCECPTATGRPGDERVHGPTCAEWRGPVRSPGISRKTESARGLGHLTADAAVLRETTHRMNLETARRMGEAP